MFLSVSSFNFIATIYASIILLGSVARIETEGSIILPTLILQFAGVND